MHSDVEPIVEEAVTEPVKNPDRYHIDLEWYKKVDRSFTSMAEGRMCSSCRAKLGMEVETRVPVLDAKGTKVVFESRLVAYGSNPVTVIRDCCSESKGYITANMPWMEVAFRILLANGNQPLTVDEIAQQMTEHITYAGGSRTMSPESLARMLKKDDYYGFNVIQVP